jgi:hypothetical protein
MHDLTYQHLSVVLLEEYYLTILYMIFF